MGKDVSRCSARSSNALLWILLQLACVYQGVHIHFAHEWRAEGILLALNELLNNKDLLPRLARRLKDIMNDISGTASRVGSTEIKTILERLQFTVLRSLELPCCLAVADFDGKVAAYWCGASPSLYCCL